MDMINNDKELRNLNRSGGYVFLTSNEFLMEDSSFSIIVDQEASMEEKWPLALYLISGWAKA